MAPGSRIRAPRPWRAAGYAASSAAAGVLRARAVEVLAPRRAETVLDVGCGAGLTFPALRRGIGDAGRLVGVDASAAMLERAGELVRRRSWDNVELVRADARELDLPVVADAALLCQVHDLVRDPAALDRVVAHLRPGARLVAAGSVWGPRWAVPLNAATWLANRAYVSSFAGFDRPWAELERRLPGVVVQRLAAYGGATYVALARVPG